VFQLDHKLNRFSGVRAARPASANRFARNAMFATTIAAAIVAIQCAHGSPSGPTGVGVSAVSLTATSLAAGANEVGTVTLTGAASAGATISLASSNPTVAAVQTPVTIQAGATSATFTVTAMAAGTATITASLNNTSGQSPTLTVTHAAALSALTLSSSTVIGGDTVIATVALSGAAPVGGASVALLASDPLTVPSSVTVPAGATTATFSILTAPVSGTVSATVTAVYGGASANATISVVQPSVATARFGVSGPSETETCEMLNDTTLNCTFNGSTSTAPGNIIQYEWTFGVATIFSQSTSTPALMNPTVTCSIMPPTPLPSGTTSFSMTVTLKVHDSQGNVSDVTTDAGVRLFPHSTCGYQ
jgi:hypothetical protein